jgi:hypothetical protein
MPRHHAPDPDDVDYDDPEDPDESDWDDDEGDEFAETIECPHCGADVYEFLEKCPQCGDYVNRTDSPTTRHPRWIPITALIILASMLAWFLVWLLR